MFLFLLWVVFAVAFSLESSASEGSFRARLEKAAKLVDAKLKDGGSSADVRYFLKWIMEDLHTSTGKSVYVVPSQRHDAEKAKVLNAFQEFFPLMPSAQRDLLEVARPFLGEYSSGFSMAENPEALQSLMSYIACVQLAYAYPKISEQSAREKIAKWDLTKCVPDGIVGVDARVWPLWKENPFVFSRVSSVCNRLSFQIHPLARFLQGPSASFPASFLHFLVAKFVANFGNSQYNLPIECELFVREYLHSANRLRKADDDGADEGGGQALVRELTQSLLPLLKPLAQSFECTLIPTTITPENRILLVRVAAWWSNLNFLNILCVKKPQHSSGIEYAMKALLLQRLAAGSKVLLSTAQVLDAFQVDPTICAYFQYGNQFDQVSLSSYEHKLLRDVEKMALLNSEFVNKKLRHCLHVTAAIEEVLLACDEVVLVTDPENARKIILNSWRNYSSDHVVPAMQAKGRLKIALKMLSSALRPATSGWCVFPVLDPDVRNWSERGRKYCEETLLKEAVDVMKLSRADFHKFTNQAVNAIIPLIAQGSSLSRGALFQGVNAGVYKVQVK